jgi:hypothetical protein
VCIKYNSKKRQKISQELVIFKQSYTLNHSELVSQGCCVCRRVHRPHSACVGLHDQNQSSYIKPGTSKNCPFHQRRSRKYHSVALQGCLQSKDLTGKHDPSKKYISTYHEGRSESILLWCSNLKPRIFLH